MTVALAVRRDRFGKFVRRVMDDARNRGITVPVIEERTGVSKATFYRWRDGDWNKDPRASQVKAFCEGLDVPVDIAYSALGWSADDRPAPTEPIIDPDVMPILRVLADPGVSEEHKQQVRATLRLIGGRPTR